MIHARLLSRVLLYDSTVQACLVLFRKPGSKIKVIRWIHGNINQIFSTMQKVKP